MARGNKFKEKLGTRHPNHEHRGDSRPQAIPRTMNEQRDPGPRDRRGVVALKRGVYVLGGVK